MPRPEDKFTPETQDETATESPTIAASLQAKAAPERLTTVEDIRAQQPQVFAMPPDEYKARENARIKAEAAETLAGWETIPGGRYKVGDKFVNAHGEEIDENGKVKE